MTFQRHSAVAIKAALKDTPAVLINGARQVGKSTLAKALMVPGSRYETLDAALTLAAASNSPEEFVAGLGDKVVIDEIQRVPELLQQNPPRFPRSKRNQGSRKAHETDRQSPRQNMPPIVRSCAL